MDTFDKFLEIYRADFRPEIAYRMQGFVWYHCRATGEKSTDIATIQEYFRKAVFAVPTFQEITEVASSPQTKLGLVYAGERLRVDDSCRRWLEKLCLEPVFNAGLLVFKVTEDMAQSRHVCTESKSRVSVASRKGMEGLKFLESDYDKVSYLVNLLTARATGLPADSQEYEMLRDQLLSNPTLAPLFPQWLRHHRNLASFWGFIKPKYDTYAERRTFLSEQFTPILDALEFGSPTTQPQASTGSHPSQPIVTRNKRKVFIVHGRDNEAKQEVCRFIEKLGLEAIILHEQASTGMTIIEKIEHYSNNADFALVLYTACDQGRGRHETSDPPKDRARQNVVFEHGYLMAKLGRRNVCSLVKGDIETPNDISGVVYVQLDHLGAWKTEVAKELVACGYAIPSIF